MHPVTSHIQILTTLTDVYCVTLFGTTIKIKGQEKTRK